MHTQSMNVDGGSVQNLEIHAPLDSLACMFENLLVVFVTVVSPLFFQPEPYVPDKSMISQMVYKVKIFLYH